MNVVYYLLFVGLITALLVHFLGPNKRVDEGFEAPLLSEEDEDDNPLDLPWIASWSPLNRAARANNSCRPLRVEKGPEGTTLVTVPSSCESGMAHTQEGDRIILPESIDPRYRDDTIKHELVHIRQRRDPEAWIAFYKSAWGFTFHTEIRGLPRDIARRLRANPDTWSSEHPCWKKRYWPLAIYDDPKSPRLRAASTVWWDGKEQRLIDQEEPPGWQFFFGKQHQNEHPHELAACMIAGEDTSSEAGRRLHQWMLTS
jgi:hypothetical protein